MRQLGLAEYLPTLEAMRSFTAERDENTPDEIWLLQHPRFGPAIANWQAHGAVSRYGKWMATITMAVCACIMLWCVPVAWVKWFSIGSMTVVAIWLWTRPLPPPAD